MSKFLSKELDRLCCENHELKYKLWFWRGTFCVAVGALTACVVGSVVLCSWYYGDVIMNLVAQVQQLGGTI